MSDPGVSPQPARCLPCLLLQPCVIRHKAQTHTSDTKQPKSSDRAGPPAEAGPLGICPLQTWYCKGESDREPRGRLLSLPSPAEVHASSGTVRPPSSSTTGPETQEAGAEQTCQRAGQRDSVKRAPDAFNVGVFKNTFLKYNRHPAFY